MAPTEDRSMRRSVISVVADRFVVDGVAINVATSSFAGDQSPCIIDALSLVGSLGIAVDRCDRSIDRSIA